MDNPRDIQVITDPSHVATLLDPTLAPPNTELAKTLTDIDADQKEKDRLKLEQLRALSKPKIEPLQLKYIWTGIDEFAHPVKTITVDTEAGFYCVAFCLTCDKEVESMKVAKLTSPAHQTNIATVNSELPAPPSVGKKK